MSHVDEGLLAAYLDGELPSGETGAAGTMNDVERHVAACPECQARLVEATRQRERARAILRGSGGPVASAPPFADIVSRARTRDAERRDARRISGLASLAWAATIVVAVGVGWYARQQSLLRTVTEPVTMSDRIVTQAPVENDVKSRASSPAGSTDAERPPARTSPRLEAFSAEKKRADVLREEPEAQNSAASPVPPSAAPAPSFAAGAPAVGAKVATRQDRDASDSVFAQRLRDNPRPLDAIVVTGQAASAEGAGVTPSNARNEARSLLGPGLSGWAPATEAAATTALGRAPFRLPGIPVSGYAVRSTGEPAVRVTQPLGPGQIVEIVQERDVQSLLAKERAADERVDANSAMSRVAPVSNIDTLEIDGYRITGRAAIPRDSLAALLRRLR